MFKREIFKKINAFALITIIFFSPILAKADNSFTFNETTKQVGPNETFSLDFTVDSVSAVSYFAAQFTYDPTVLEYVDMTSYGIFNSPMQCMDVSMAIGSNPPGTIEVTLNRFPFDFLFPCQFDLSGSLFTLNFQSKDFAGESEITTNSNTYTVNGFTPVVNSFTASVTVEVVVPDTEDPIISILAPSDTGSFDYSSTTSEILVSGSASDNVGVRDVSVTVNKADGSSVMHLASGTSTWEQMVELTEGTNTVDVYAYDDADNFTMETITIEYSIPDTESPVVVITTPSDTGSYDLVSDTASTTVSGTASDNVGVRDVSVTVNKADGSSVMHLASGTSTWEQMVELTEGTNTVDVYAYDDADNFTMETITINYSKPIIIKPAPAPSSGGGSGIPYYTYENQGSKTPEITPATEDEEEQVEVLGVEFEAVEEIAPVASVETDSEYPQDILDAYKYVFGSYPESEADFADVERMMTGHWTMERNADKENYSKEVFKKVYLREADMNNQHDASAIMLMTYSIRPVQADTEKEKVALSYYEAIFNDKPETIFEHNVVRAIAYSGATR